jgi:phage-related protein
MGLKPIDWRGSSLRDIKNENIFTLEARKRAGYQLSLVQMGIEPRDWKPFDGIGPGIREIRLSLDDGWFRVMYVAKFPEAVYVLHCFKKKTASTNQHDKDVVRVRYNDVIKERNGK